MKITNLQKCIPEVTGILPGLVPVLLIGAAAWWFGKTIPILGGPVAAILIGLAAGEIFGHRPQWERGLLFSSKTVLQASIVLLGAEMSLAKVARIGIDGLPVMAGTLVICVGAGIVIGRAMQIEHDTRVLITYGTAICGASAIATMSAVIGATGPAIAISVTVIVAYNVLAAIVFPAVGHMLGLSQEAFGMWSGTAINDTSSVVAAAAVYGTVAAGYAVVVKLTRTLALVPLAVFQSWFQNRDLPEEKRREMDWYRLIPLFLVLFLVAVMVQSAGLIPEAWSGPVKFLAYFGITAAMAAVGMRSSFSAIRSTGWKPLAFGGILWILVAVSSLVLQWLTGQL
ncbi:MAG TPA: putative sulfate exporter family transporter [Methanoregula sp.]|nr:putative sulfate exporter family transporter [Methanoregula sp.]